MYKQGQLRGEPVVPGIEQRVVCWARTESPGQGWRYLTEEEEEEQEEEEEKQKQDSLTRNKKEIDAHVTSSNLIY